MMFNSMIIFISYLSIYFFLSNIYVTFVLSFLFLSFGIKVCFKNKTSIENIKKNNNKTHVLISILIPVYNEEKDISKLLESLFEKNKKYIDDVEVIFINDGSTDNSLNVLSKYNEKYNFQLINICKQKLVSDVLNIGLKYVNKETTHIGVVNADSIVSENCLKLVKERLSNYPIDALNLHNASKVYNKFNIYHYYANLEKEYRNNLFVLNEASLNNGYFVLKKHITKWDTITEDQNLCLKLKKKGVKIYQDEKIIIYDNLPHRFSTLFRQKFRWNYGDLYNRFIFLPTDIYDVIITVFFLFPLFTLFHTILSIFIKVSVNVYLIQLSIIGGETLIFFKYKKFKIKYLHLSFIYALFQFLFQIFFYIKYIYKHLMYKVEW